jgi:HEAT repeat protein
LCKILGDKNYAPGDRRSAAEALGEIGDPSIFPLLVNIIHDQYEPTPVRCGVALGIGALRTKLPASPRMPNPDLTIYDLLEHVLKVKGNPLDLRASAAEALSNFSNMDVIPLLNQIAAEHPTDILGFSAAESAVKLTEGAVKDVSFVKAIYGYQIDPEEKSFYIPKKHDLLQKIAEHGTTWRVRLAARNGNTLIMDVPIGIVIIAFIVGSVVTLKWWRRKKNGMRLQALQSSPTENAI